MACMLTGVATTANGDDDNSDASPSPGSLFQPRRQHFPGDADVGAWIASRVTPYDGDEGFLAPPTERTLRAWKRAQDLMAEEALQGGVLDVDVTTAASVTAFEPGYLLSSEDDIIVGLQGDAPLKRLVKPRGGFRVVRAALESYGYKPDPTMAEIYANHVQTLNDLVFKRYSAEVRRARHAHLLLGLPDAYSRGRIIGDYRRAALFGTEELLRRKHADYAHLCKPPTHSPPNSETLRLRGEVTAQITALRELEIMADSYGVDMRHPAKSFREAAQYIWLAYLAAIKEQDGAAMSFGRVDAFLDIFAEADLASGEVSESDLQEVVDDLVVKMRIVRHLRTPAYNALFSGDPVWCTMALGGCGEDGSTSLVTKTTFRILHTLTNLSPAPEPNLTCLWSTRLPAPFKRYVASVSIASSSIQFENDDLMREMGFGSDYSIACCVSAMQTGKQMQFFGARVNLAKLLLLVLNAGRDENEGVELCAPLAAHPDAQALLLTEEEEELDFDMVYKLFFEVAVPWCARLYIDAMNAIHQSHDEVYYEAVEMAFHDTSVGRFMAFGIAGLSVVADSLSAIRHAHVKVTRDEKTGLTTGFPSTGRYPAFGNNDCFVDGIAKEICERFMDALRAYRTRIYRGATPSLSVLTITSNIVYGSHTGSTPDGRLRGEPFAPGANPMHERDASGAIASLLSVAKLPYAACLDGISNTFCLTPSALGRRATTGSRPRNLVTILDAYFSSGGHHLNINVLSRDMLNDARMHPERYPNLTVRVSGYAVRFNALTDEQQEEFMKRTFHASAAGASARTMRTAIPTSGAASLDELIEAEEIERYGSATCMADVEDLSSSCGVKSAPNTVGGCVLSPPAAAEVRAAFDASLASGDRWTAMESLRATSGAAAGPVLVGAVHSVETFSTTDGPGIRAVLFLQGCTRRCRFCSNPDSLAIYSDPAKSVPELAMTDVQVEELVLKPLQPFLSPNNGGITLSGGDPLVQPFFAAAIFRRARSLGLTTCLDTAGTGSPNCWDAVLPHTTHVLLCPKVLGDDKAYAELVGDARGAAVCRKFAKHIVDHYVDAIRVTVRWVLIDGVTDTDEQVSELGDFCCSLGLSFHSVELLPYHEFGKAKWEALGWKYPMAGVAEYTRAKAMEFAERLEKTLAAVLSPSHDGKGRVVLADGRGAG